MNQTQWDARVADLPGLWQYFRMDDDSPNLPADASGNAADMDNVGGAQVLAYHQGGPFDGADGIELQTGSGFGVYSSVQNPPTNTVNYGHPKAMECWYKPTVSLFADEMTLIGAGNIGVVIDLDMTLRITWWGNPNAFSANTTETLTIGEWYYILLSSTGSDNLDLWLGQVDVEPVVVAQITDSSFSWPVPNGSLLKAGAGPAFGEAGTAEGVYSNMALWTEEDAQPDLPVDPVLIAMSAKLP